MILQKGMRLRPTTDLSAPQVQLVAVGDDARFPSCVFTAGDNALPVRIATGGDATRIPKVKVSGIPSTNLAAWFQPGVGVTGTLTASNWADQSGNGRDLAQGTAGNQPIYLPYSGTPYAYLPGVTGNYFSTPAAAANQITSGTLDIRVKVALNDWTPSANVDLVSRFLTDGQSAYRFMMRSDNFLSFAYTATGGFAGIVQAIADAATGITDAAEYWVRVTYVTATGKVNFYKSADGETWSSIGSEISITSGSIFAGTDALQVGQGTNGTITGKVYRVLLYSGSTLKQDFNPADFAETSTNGATAVSSTTGETWTLNSTGAKPAQVVKSASLLGDGTNHWMQTAAFTFNQPETVYLVLNQVSWTSNDFIFDGITLLTGAITQKNGGASPEFTVNAGAAITNSTATIGAKQIITTVINGASSLAQVNNLTSATGDAGASNLGGLTIMRAGDTVVNAANVQMYELIAFSAAHSAAERSVVQNYLAARHQIAL